MKTPKIRTPPPGVNDRVRLRGRAATGVLLSINKIQWCRVLWDAEAMGPKHTHLNELEKIT